ncbi:MAG: hypothetical protein V4543_16800 [Bacteroidota bacterium]
MEKAINLLKQIEAMQSAGNRFFPAGLFPVWRKSPLHLKARPDPDFFLTASVLFTLDNIIACLDHKGSAHLPEVEAISDRIRIQAYQAYPLFRNAHPDGTLTYNFWPRKPGMHFPFGLIFRHLQSIAIPDDIDDTALAFLTMPHTPAEAQLVQNKLQFHANKYRKTNTTALSFYRNEPIPNTWFGSKMLIEFDVCALLNLLHMCSRYGLPWDDRTAAALRFVRSVLLHSEHFNYPFISSPYYAEAGIILYHYARFAAEFPGVLGADCLQKIENDCRHILSADYPEGSRLMAYISLSRLGLYAERPSVDEDAFISGFSFSVAGWLSAFEGKRIRRLAEKPFLQFRFFCPAFSLALLAEAEVYAVK